MIDRKHHLSFFPSHTQPMLQIDSVTPWGPSYLAEFELSLHGCICTLTQCDPFTSLLHFNSQVIAQKPKIAHAELDVTDIRPRDDKIINIHPHKQKRVFL